jgi:hypothetical protein
LFLVSVFLCKITSNYAKDKILFPKTLYHCQEMTEIEPAICLPMEIIEVPERKDCYVISIHAEAAEQMK